MAHFDADPETVARLKRLGLKKISPLDMDLTRADRELSPEELEMLSKPFWSSKKQHEPDSED